MFIARAENAASFVWRIVSPDTTNTYPAKDAPDYFKGLKVSGTDSDRLVLENIPASMNGWKAECKFIAADGKTAKGLWQVMGANNAITPNGPLSTWNWGYVAADFVLEDDEWKIWHLQEFTELSAPVASSWVAKTELPVMPEFASLADLKLPAPTVAAKLYEVYSPEREYTAPQKMPEPYNTFAETFSYGMN